MTQTITKQNTPNAATKKNIATAQILADSIIPLFAIGDAPQNTWWLWLDFVAEIQAQLMIVSEATNEDGFAFRCAENFKALRQMLAILADNKIDMPPLQHLKAELQQQKNELKKLQAELDTLKKALPVSPPPNPSDN